MTLTVKADRHTAEIYAMSKTDYLACMHNISTHAWQRTASPSHHKAFVRLEMTRDAEVSQADLSIWQQ